LTLIQTGDNLGFAGGNNVGIRYALAKGDCGYVWLLNNDTVIDKCALIEMVEMSESDINVGMAGAKIFFYNKPNIIEAIGGSSINLKTLSSHAYFEEDQRQWDKPIEPNYITAASMLVRKHLIDRIGLLNEAYFMYIEDLDWSLKAKSEGYKLIYSYKSMIWHKKGSSTEISGNWGNFLGRKSSRPSMKKFSTTYYYNIRNRVYFAKKYFLAQRLACFFIYFPFKILRLVSGIYLYNDDHKSLRIKLIFKAVYDGLIGKMGKTV
ncbi:MAG: glycosyltransferase family 2 protein, partial [Candidatus Aenigmarchaeota archaeon]|nr:glycosyltransferase family 2 protein [Candidatus Aenigmarchaeota archaeon]